MPQLDLSSEVSMYYEIIPSKAENPWLLLLHPLLTDLSWIKCFADQADINENFNCILFDNRLHGRTRCSVSATLDFNTFAADIAMAMQKLQLPPVCLVHFSKSDDIWMPGVGEAEWLTIPIDATNQVHIIAGQTNAGEVALRLAAIFPEKVSSLFLCGLAPDV